MSESIKEVDARKKKRKRESATMPEIRRIKPREVAQESGPEDDIQSEILLLEHQILESREHYNSIAILLGYLRENDTDNQRDVAAAVALCRIFCRLMAAGSLTDSREISENESTIIQWLKDRLVEYESLMLAILKSKDLGKQSTALTLLMRLMKGQAEHLKLQGNSVWLHGLFSSVLLTLVSNTTAHSIRVEFIEKYLVTYDDIRYYTFAVFADLVFEYLATVSVEGVISMLAEIEILPEMREHVDNFFIALHTKKTSHQSVTVHKKQAQKAWLAILRLDLSRTQRKTVLGLMSHRIAPWFLKAELLMDFLTDSFSVGGSISLMALSGLFYLMQEKNLDYPQFYHKLYSLLDSTILHSKHRSRFFRLLDTFLASTHLPAALVASFIKRLSRLCLNAPPSGIVAVVPWIYNLLKIHPICTFMVHRKARGERGDAGLEENGYRDAFRMDEPDPMETDALDSSLWEIQMLQSHYHPNVATIAKIISEQFTKQAYNLEDFLDHSYGSMLDAELSKDIKKAPEVEYEIPKKVFMKYGKDEKIQDSLLVKLWDFS